jgi:peroxiredoxin
MEESMRSFRAAHRFAVAATIVAFGLAAAGAAESTSAAFLGKPAPAFSLPDSQGKTHELSEFTTGKGAVVIWVSTQCPVSNAYNERMSAIAKEYQGKGLNFVGINSNKEEKSTEIAEHSKQHGFSFPVLKDEGNKIADLYGASVTPEVYVIDAKGTLRYHGRIDDNMKESGVTTQDLRAALDLLVAGQEITKAESKAFGCTIKRINKAGA